MIGDTLFDCGESLDHYLRTYEWTPEVEARVRLLREQIRAVQEWLDAGPFELIGNVRVKDESATSIPEFVFTSGYPPRHTPGRG